ncbi:hypothetical protein [Taibaiella koreensis]|uniref:hypothetical protein n=1 Tax=Taibaiella koreensis TaxID=1268548 RepID=UPI0013C31ABA|nr:hypothetical protein [Taibaiella koreensis]
MIRAVFNQGRKGKHFLNTKNIFLCPGQISLKAGKSKPFEVRSRQIGTGSFYRRERNAKTGAEHNRGHELKTYLYR